MKTKKPKSLIESFGGIVPDLHQVFQARIDQLQPNPHQPRKEFHPKRLRELADSIAEHGLIYPITVKAGAEDETYVIITGERRVRAHKLLGREHINAILTDGDLAQLALIENLQREDLHPLEQAEALAEMMNLHGYKQKELASIVGKSTVTVNELLRLNHLAPEIKDDFRNSEVTKTLALAVSRQKDPEKQRKLWHLAKKGMTLTQARARKKGPPKAPDIVAIAAGERFLKLLTDLPADGSTRDELRTLREQIIAAFDAIAS